MNIELIVATDEEMGIGKDNKIPWYYPDDLLFFKSQAERNNTVLVCGTNTYKSLPIIPFKNRQMYVLTNSLKLTNPKHIQVNSVNEILEKQKNSRLLIIGGAFVYSQFLNYTSKIFWTKIPGNYNCDVIFPIVLSNLRILNKIKINELLNVYELTLI